MSATLTRAGLMTALIVLVAGCGLVAGTGAHAVSTGSAAQATVITPGSGRTLSLGAPTARSNTDLPAVGECAWRPAPQPPHGDPRWHGQDPATHLLMVNYCNGPIRFKIIQGRATTGAWSNADLPAVGECAWRPVPQPPPGDPRWHGQDPTSHLLMVNYCNGPTTYKIIQRQATTPSSSGRLGGPR